MGLEYWQKEAIHYTMTATLALSTVGCLFICLIYISFRDIRSFAFRLVLYMSLADIAHAIGFFLPSHPHNECIVQGCITSVFSLSSVLWTAAIAFTLHQAVIHRKNDVEVYEKYLLGFAYGLPLLVVIPSLTQHLYSDGDGWCWIDISRSYLKGTIWRFVTFYIPLWLVIAYNLFVYWSVIRLLRRQMSQVLVESDNTEKLLRKLRLYPAILVGCYSVATANRVYQTVTREDCFELSIIGAGIMCLCGFFNAIVYGFTDTVKDRLKEWWAFSVLRKGSQSTAFIQDIA